MVIKKLSQKVLKSLKQNTEFLKIFKNVNNLEVLVKNLDPKELQRLFFEYPGFLNKNKNDFSNLNQNIESNEELPSILSLTLIKNDIETSNYSNLKKIKFYINETNGKIIRVLQN